MNGWLPTDYVQKIDGDVSGGSVGGGGASSEPIPLEVSKPVAQTIETIATEANTPAAATPAAPATPIQQAQPAAVRTPENVVAPSTNLSQQLNNLLISTGSGSSVAAPSNPNQKICFACNEPIKSAFVMARDKPFHPNHFQCFTCQQELGGRAYLEKDGQFYCEADYYAAFNPKWSVGDGGMEGGS